MKHWILLVIILLGVGLRWHHAIRDVRFHSDEALYTTYARNAAVHGDWMLSGPVDKPPLSIYTNALAMHFTAAQMTDLGVIDVPIKQGEFAAKVPNVLAGIVLIPVLYALVMSLHGHRRTAQFAALIVAVSPYAVAYSASAFTDMLMLVFMTAAVLASVRGHLGWSGVLMALSFTTKPQGVLYLPLVVIFVEFAGVVRPRFIPPTPSPSSGRRGDTALLNPLYPCGRGDLGVRAMTHRFSRFMLGCLGVILLLLMWDATRPETSVFTLGSVNISQGRALTPPDEWLPRLLDWAQDGDNLLGSPILTVILIAVGVVPAVIRRVWLDMLFLVMVVGYCALHLFGAFFTFDRYLLPLVPLLAVLSARGIVFLGLILQIMTVQTRHASSVHTPLNGFRHKGAIFLITATILTAAFSTHDPRADAYHGTSPQALIDLAEHLNAKPLGAIIYDRWMGWEMGYYIGAWSDKRRVYYPDPQVQAQDALLNPDPAPRYMIAPTNQDYAPWLAHFEDAGFAVSLNYERDGFAVYTLIPPFSDASNAGSSSPGQELHDD